MHTFILYALCLDLIGWTSVQQGPNSFAEASNMPMKTTLSANIVQPSPSNYRFVNFFRCKYRSKPARITSGAYLCLLILICSSGYADEYDNGGTMQFKDTIQFKDAASAARAAAESAAQAASAAKAAADLANKSAHSSDEDEDEDEDDDWKTTLRESTNSSRRQSMSNTSRSSRKENVVSFDDIKSQGSTWRRLSGSNHVEDKDTDVVDLGTGKMRRRSSRKVHSEIKFDDSEGWNSEAEDESDAEIQSMERPPPPNRESHPGNHHSEEKEPEDDFPDPPKANSTSRVHPNMPLDFETLTARFEALRSSGKLP